MKYKKDTTKKSSLEKKLELLKQVSLGDEEKDRMDSFLSGYVGMHPVMGEQERVLKERREKNSLRVSFFGRAIPVLGVAVFFVYGGIALAESSLPGDPLYGIKTGTEDVRGSFLFDEEKKARFEAERISRRLNEAHRLVQSGAVSEGATERLARELEENLLSLQKSLDVLNAKDRQMVVFEIEKSSSSRVKMYQNIFAKMSEEDDNASGLLSDIALHIDLLSDYFRGKDKTAIALEGDSQKQTMSMLALDELPAEEDFASDQDELNSDSAIVRIDPDDSERFADSESWLDTDALKLYVSLRIEETERLINSTRRIDERIKDALERRLSETRTLFESGVSVGMKSENEMESRSRIFQSLDMTNDLRSLLDMSSGRLFDSFIQFILDELETKEETTVIDEDFILDFAEEVRGSRESSETSDNEEEESREEEVESGVVDEEPSGEDEEGSPTTPSVDEVRKILDEIRL